MNQAPLFRLLSDFSSPISVALHWFFCSGISSTVIPGRSWNTSSPVSISGDTKISDVRGLRTEKRTENNDSFANLPGPRDVSTQFSSSCGNISQLILKVLNRLLQKFDIGHSVHRFHSLEQTIEKRGKLAI